MDAFGYVLSNYHHPSRHYHNLDHITRMLTGVYDYAPDMIEYQVIDYELYLAILFHDYDYVFIANPKPSNEAMSARAFETWRNCYCPMDEYGHFGDPIVKTENVVAMILATEHHFDGTEYTDRKTNVLLDLDLLAFADDYLKFKNTQIAIDNEYILNYDRDIVMEKRHAFLKSIYTNQSLKYRAIDPTGILTARAYDNIEKYLIEKKVI